MSRPAKPFSLEDFKKKAKAVHGKKYSYSKSIRDNKSRKVLITCFKHGDFWQSPKSHTEGHGCRKCGKEYVRKGISKPEFLQKFKKIHGSRFDLTRLDYIKSTLPVSLECKIHGMFYRTPISLLAGQSCNKCSLEKSKLGLTEFLARAKDIHGKTYDYSKVIYFHINEPVVIVCRIHGEFQQTPSHHFAGSGCKKCAFSTHTGFQREAYSLGSREVKVQGYEPQALDYIQKVIGVEPSKIEVGATVPSIMDYDPVDKKNRWHYPDFFIPSQNRIVEVKSVWTFFKGLLYLRRKRRAAVDLGFKYSVLLMTGKGKRVPLPRSWFLLSESCLRRFFDRLNERNQFSKAELN